jgi:lysophospholipase L1-like esterase
MKIFVIGDSISMHYGPYLKQYLNGIAEYDRKEGDEEAMLNLDIPQGANGGDSSMVLTYLKAKNKAGGIDADFLLLNCGLHDIKTDIETGEKQITIENYKENMLAILEFVSSMKQKLVWIRTTPCDEVIHNKPDKPFHRFAADCSAYNQVSDEIMAKAGIPSIDLYTFTSNLGKGSDLYCDHVHFPDHIREKQAAFIAGWVQANL